MSERKVLSKYYPADFDPSALTRRRGPKQEGPKVQTVRLMAPFSMRCTACGEYIYRGRKFNARKETPEEKYLGIQIYRFYIKCTRCSQVITFRTDPANQDYMCEKGAKRNTDPWKRGLNGGTEGNDDGGGGGCGPETEEERLDRLERERGEEEEEKERNAMAELEAKTADAKREMAVADALDEIRTRNARLALRAADREGAGEFDALNGRAYGDGAAAAEKARQDMEDEEAARRAFAFARGQAAELGEEVVEDDDAAAVAEWGRSSSDAGESSGKATAPASATTSTSSSSSTTTATTITKSTDMAPPPVPSFKRQVKKKTDRASLLGIKKKTSV